MLRSLSSSCSRICLSTLVSSLLLTGYGTARNPYEDEAKRALGQALVSPARLDETSRVYHEALEKARREDKPFLVWVGGVCPPCVKSMPWAVHVVLDSLERDPSQRVVLGRSDAAGVMRRIKTWSNHFPSSEEVEAALVSRTPAPRKESVPYQGCPPSG